jgi:serine/threonine protein kinase
MELLQFPTLRDILDEQNMKFSERLALEITVKLAEALEHIHSKGFAHRDVKLENCCLRADNEPILFDFGLAFTGKYNGDVYVGSPLYMAPEVLLERESDPFSTDVWGLGLILYGLISGDTPNSDVDDIRELEAIMSSMTSFSFPFACSSPALTKLLEGMLAFDPHHRWKVFEVIEYIRELLEVM